MYIATVILHLSEFDFWKMTPAKFFLLLDCHNEFNSVGEKAEPKELSVEEAKRWSEV